MFTVFLSDLASNVIVQHLIKQPVRGQGERERERKRKVSQGWNTLQCEPCFSEAFMKLLSFSRCVTVNAVFGMGIMSTS